MGVVRARTGVIARSGTTACGQAHVPDGFISRWPGRPARCPPVGMAGVVAAVAVWAAVLNVAAVATPLPFSVTVTGFFSPKFWQLRLVKDMLSRLARKVSRLLPTAGTGLVPVASSVWLLARNGVCVLTMFWQ